ncbi:tyrosine-type recombinase/integrase [Actinomadura formosensis]|uniref:tyrosine-type recombinase/integrase n=1 Tax=Actinomadura formosensis TaxID=60706 RepID=UPI003D8C9AD4
MFVGVQGGQVRRSNFSKTWARALESAGLEVGAIHVHDLRHTGNTYAAESGASLAELMNRTGHSSTPTDSGAAQPPGTSTLTPTKFALNTRRGSSVLAALRAEAWARS